MTTETHTFNDDGHANEAAALAALRMLGGDGARLAEWFEGSSNVLPPRFAAAVAQAATACIEVQGRRRQAHEWASTLEEAGQYAQVDLLSPPGPPAQVRAW